MLKVQGALVVITRTGDLIGVAWTTSEAPASAQITTSRGAPLR